MGEVKEGAVAERSTHFAWLRTRFAVHRTLMAWIRTSTALIGFGFTIFQFFDRLSSAKGILPPREPGLTHWVAIALVAIGTLGAAVGLGEYHLAVRYLWSAEFRDIAGMGERPRLTSASVVAALIVLVGFIVFAALVYRMRG